ncbi:MAG TPA: histone deacetylase [Treponemataceae bacterium]|nr:histone deacetylase [Treponemataceae bacterium]
MKAKNKLGLVFFPAFDWAISPTHPEREERLLYTQDQIFEEGIGDIEGIKMFNPIVAKDEDIQRVHFCVPDVKTRLTESHFISVGGAIRAGQAVMTKQVDKSFALIRPPGHHAHRVVYGDRGFCVVNVEAVMLEKLRKEYGPLRVAIVDSDCHHGDGTEDIYWNDKDTLFISFHQDGRTIFPGTGSIKDLGGPSAFGYNVNIPLPPNTGDEGFLYVLEQVVMPILEDYKPDIIINSAGQDNHYSDPITNMNFTAQGYAKLNHILNPDIAVLEGGYSIEGALPYVNLGIVLAMAGLDYSQVHEPDYDEKKLRQSKSVSDHIKKTAEIVLELWKNKEALGREKFKNVEVVQRHKQVYYDTDGIMNTEVQHFKRCTNCSGVNWIDSRSDSGYKVLAITIPRDACVSCIDEGYTMHKNPSKEYSNVFLQDKAQDTYLR